MTDIQIHTDPEIVEVVRRIDSLRSTENVSLEEKIRIAELVLSILEERKKDDVVVQ
jgi:endonuclease III